MNGKAPEWYEKQTGNVAAETVASQCGVLNVFHSAGRFIHADDLPHLAKAFGVGMDTMTRYFYKPCKNPFAMWD